MKYVAKYKIIEIMLKIKPVLPMSILCILLKQTNILKKAKFEKKKMKVVKKSVLLALIFLRILTFSFKKNMTTKNPRIIPNARIQ